MTLPRDLGDGLVLRRATRGDTEALVALNSRVHDYAGPFLSRGIGCWTRTMPPARTQPST